MRRKYFLGLVPAPENIFFDHERHKLQKQKHLPQCRFSFERGKRIAFRWEGSYRHFLCGDPVMTRIALFC
jgi:hypothetical protein